jgi:hypothetical protein
VYPFLLDAGIGRAPGFRFRPLPGREPRQAQMSVMVTPSPRPRLPFGPCVRQWAFGFVVDGFDEATILRPSTCYPQIVYKYFTI